MTYRFSAKLLTIVTSIPALDNLNINTCSHIALHAWKPQTLALDGSIAVYWCRLVPNSWNLIVKIGFFETETEGADETIGNLARHLQVQHCTDCNVVRMDLQCHTIESLTRGIRAASAQIAGSHRVRIEVNGRGFRYL